MARRSASPGIPKSGADADPDACCASFAGRENDPYTSPLVLMAAVFRPS